LIVSIRAKYFIYCFLVLKEIAWNICRVFIYLKLYQNQHSRGCGSQISTEYYFVFINKNIFSNSSLFLCVLWHILWCICYLNYSVLWACGSYDSLRCLRYFRRVRLTYMYTGESSCRVGITENYYFYLNWMTKFQWAITMDYSHTMANNVRRTSMEHHVSPIYSNNEVIHNRKTGNKTLLSYTI
jgi:hypothetical protein